MNIHKNVTIIIGSFNLANYDEYPEINKGGNLLFFHAPATWFIKDKDIRQRLIRPGELIEQQRLEQVDDNSIIFVKELAKSTKHLTFDGINFIEVLRHKIARRYGTIVEAFLILNECFKRYKPAMVVLDSSCKQNIRSRTYCEVAGYLLKKYKISFINNYQHNEGTPRSHNKSKRIQHCLKEWIRKFISLVINLINYKTKIKDTILFFGAFFQFEQILKWFADAKCYRLVYFKEAIPFRKIPFFLKNKVLWQKIPEIGADSKRPKNHYVEDLSDNLFNTSDIISRFFQNEVALADMIKAYIKDELYKNWSRYKSLVVISNRVFSNPKIKGLFVAEDQLPLARIVVDLANLHKKQTFLICHGILDEKTNFLFSVKNIYTYGRKVSQQIKEYSREFKPHIFEVGMPRLNNLKLLNPAYARNKLCKDLSIDHNKKIILFTPGPLSFNTNFYANNVKKNRQIVYFETLNHLKKLIEKTPKIHVIVKLHPGTYNRKESSYYKNFFDGEEMTPIDYPYDIDILVKGCDLVMHCITTVAYHGLVARKPIVRVRGEVENVLWEFLDSGAEEILEIDSPLFDKKITNILFDEQKRKMLCERADKYLKANYSCEDLNVKNRVLSLTSAILKGGT